MFQKLALQLPYLMQDVPELSHFQLYWKKQNTKDKTLRDSRREMKINQKGFMFVKYWVTCEGLRDWRRMMKRMVMSKKIVFGVEVSMQHVKQRLCNSHMEYQNCN